MSDSGPRKITGLSPRRDQAPLSRLMKSERDRTSSPPAPPATAAPVAPAPTPTVAPAPAAIRPPADSAAATDAKEAVTFRLPITLRQRSRAVYLATRTAENDESYSEMVAKAIETELRRREAVHHGGQPYGGGAAQLPSGRPFAG